MSAPNSSTQSRQPIRAPRGSAISCKGWQQEAALRMLMNSLDRDVAEGPEELVIHGSLRAARDWESFQIIAAALRTLENDQTLTIEAGTPAGLTQSDPSAPRVIIEHPREHPAAHVGEHQEKNTNADPAERARAFYSRATHTRATYALAPDGWAYVGSQSVLPVAYEVFAAAAREHFGGSLGGRLVLAGGMGGLGGALPLAATLYGAAFLGVDADPERIKRRVKSGYCEVMVNDVDEALRILKNAVRKHEPASVGLIGNCADLIPELAQRGVVPDLVTDLTSADDPANGYIPRGLTPQQAAELRAQDTNACRARALDSIAAHLQGLLDLRKLGSIVFDFGNNITAAPHPRGDVTSAQEIPKFAARYLKPLFDQGASVVTVVALSGEPRDIAQADRLLVDLSPADPPVSLPADDPLSKNLRAWIALASKHVRYQGLPARTCWLTADQTTRLVESLDRSVANGELRAPMLIAAAEPFSKSPTWIQRENDGSTSHAQTIRGNKF